MGAAVTPPAHAASAHDALPPNERIDLLDVARGFALGGILVINLPTFTAAGAMPAPIHTLNHAVDILRDMLFSGKFNSIFSLLFGLGFSLQFARLQARLPDQATTVYLRRLGWLFGLGLLHAALFWHGDVLHMYALLGVTLLWLRHWPDRALLWLMAACLLGPALSQAARGLWASTPVAIAAGAAPATGWSEAEMRIYGEGSLLDTMRQNLQGFGEIYSAPAKLRSQLGFYAQILTTMVLGLLIGRHRYIQRLPALMPTIKRVQVGSLVVGVSCSIAYGLGHDVSQGPWRGLIGSCYVIGRLGLMGFYVLTLVRLMQDPAWQRRLSPLAAVGRMPLTNYLLQTALCSLLFYGWGLGLWDRVDTFGALLAAPLVFFCVQLPLSLWWLRRWQQGPFEWLWRRATYGRDAR